MWCGRDAVQPGETAGVVASDLGKAVLVINPAKLAEVLSGPNGPVTRRMLEDGEIVKQEARRIVRVHKPVPGERRNRRPGQLRDGIVKRVGGKSWSNQYGSGTNVVVQVGSTDPIAMIEHEGTEPHDIAPRNAARLVFWSGKAGKVIYMKPGQKVRHPGTTGSHYLTKAMENLRSRY